MNVPHEQVERLRSGDVGAWNAWRFSDLSMRPSLVGVDVRGRSLRGLALWRMRVSDCRFDGAGLREADLRECDAFQASSTGADLSRAACWQSRFRACEFCDAILDSANFEGCNLGELRPNAAPTCYLLPPWHSPDRPPPPPPPDGALAVALLGDCTMSCGYLAPSRRPSAALAAKLAEVGRPAFVYDLSEDGGSVATLLQRYERDVRPVPRIDVAFVRFGVTDRKDYGSDRFVDLLGRLCRKLERHSPGLSIAIETGMHVDYPAHYPFDRNAKLAPLYERAGRFAADRGYALVDIYSELERRTAAGDWDWRIRGLGIGRPSSLHDASQDHLHAGDPDWFFNIHPNRRCIELIADLERGAIAESRAQAT
jgi:acyl-CoA thioesterase-1